MDFMSHRVLWSIFTSTHDQWYSLFVRHASNGLGKHSNWLCIEQGTRNICQLWRWILTYVQLFLSIRKACGWEYEPDTLTSYQRACQVDKNDMLYICHVIRSDDPIQEPITVLRISFIGSLLTYLNNCTHFKGYIFQN